MAYKFQLGAAKLSGSIEQSDGADIKAQTSFSIGDATVNEAQLEILDGATVTTTELNLLDAIPQGSIIFGNGSSESARLTVGAENTVLSTDGSDISYTKVSNAMLAGSIANGKLVNDSITLSAGAGMAALAEVELGATQIIAVDGVLEDLDTLGAPTADGEFIVASAAGVFAYESGATAMTSLGITTYAQSILDDANAAAAATTLGLGTGDDVTFTTGSFSGDLTVTGDFTVNGTSTTVNSTIVEIADKNIILASGGGDDSAANGGGFTVSSSAGDKTFNYVAANQSLQSNQHLDIVTGKGYLVNGNPVLTADGAYKVQAAVGGVGLAHDAGVLSLDFNQLPDSTAIAVANDSIVFLDSDGNASRRSTIADLAEFMAGAGITATNGQFSTAAGALNPIDNLGTGSVGINYWADLAGNESMVLPASPVVGDSIRVKAPSNCGAAGTITISPLTVAHSIDGASSIILESPHAAVEMVYVTTNLWKVF